MKTALEQIIEKISETYNDQIAPDSNVYMEVDIGRQAERLGHRQVKEAYHHVNVVVPIKQAVEGMKVMIDGRTFIDYAQIDSGIAVPGRVARAAGIGHKAYRAPESMILNF